MNSPPHESIQVTTTPVLATNAVTDADGDGDGYYFRVATNPDAENGQIVNSGWQNGTTWQVPAGSLRDGVTYYWHVWSTDGKSWIQPTWKWSFKVDLRLGNGSVAPTDSAGRITTNLATGNVTTQISTPLMPTVGGGMNVSLTYNSQLPSDRGLTGTYWNDVNYNRRFDDDGSPALVRQDAQVSFDWGAGSVNAALWPDNVLAQWDG